MFSNAFDSSFNKFIGISLNLYCLSKFQYFFLVSIFNQLLACSVVHVFTTNLVVCFGFKAWKSFTIKLAKNCCKYNIQGVPKKTLFYVSQAIEGTRSGLETKVGWVLKNSGNFLSDEHKNSSFLSKNDWEKWGQRCLPPLWKGMIVDHPKDIFLYTNLKEKIDW